LWNEEGASVSCIRDIYSRLRSYTSLKKKEGWQLTPLHDRRDHKGKWRSHYFRKEQPLWGTHLEHITR
jgi:hypothetical protein